MDKTTARIAAFSQKDAEAWKALTASFPAEAEHIFGLLGSPMNMRALASTSWRLYRKKGIGGSLDLVRFLMTSPRKWLNDTFESDHVKATLGAWGMHLDFAPDIAGGALFPYLESMANQAFGMVLGKGGADTIIRAVVSTIEARGGSVVCDAPVTRIINESGKATGVELEDGRTFTASRAVIANVTPAAMLKMTGGTADSGYDAAMKRFSHAPGTMMIHLAMDDLPDWQAGATRLWTMSDFRSPSAAAFRTNCPAASVSASASPVPSR